MRSWAKAYGALTIAAAIAYLVAMVLAIVKGNVAFDASLQNYFAYKYFKLVTSIAGVLLIAAGALAAVDGMKSVRASVTAFGLSSILAGIVIISLHSIGANLINTNDMLLYLFIVFIAYGLSVVAKEGMNGFLRGALISAVLVVVLDVLYILTIYNVSSAYFGYFIAVILVVAGIMCPLSDRRYTAIMMAVAAREAAAEKAAREAEEKRAEKYAAAKAAADAKYAEEKAAKKAAEEEAAKKAAEEKAAAEEEAKKAAAEEAKKAAEEKAAAPAEEAKKAAEEKVVEEAAPAVAEEKPACNALAIVLKAIEAKGMKTEMCECGAAKLSAEKIVVDVFEGQPDCSKDADLQSKGWTIARFDGSEVTDGQKEAEVVAALASQNAGAQDAAAAAAAAVAAEEAKKAAEEEAAKKAAEEAAAAAAAEEAKKAAEEKAAEEAAAKAQKEAAAAAAAVAAATVVAAAEEKPCALAIVVKAIEAKGMKTEMCKCGAAKLPAEKIAVDVFEGQPDMTKGASLEAEGWTIARFDGSEVTDGQKEAEVVAVLAAMKVAEADVVEEAAVYEEVSEDMDDEYDDIDLGLEPWTVETPVRRAMYNKGYRFRRKYGKHEIPVAFVSAKVAVYVFEGKPETSKDAVLEKEGWTILRFDGSEVTDGQKEAEIIVLKLKEITRAKKAAAAKAKRAKARKKKSA